MVDKVVLLVGVEVVLDLIEVIDVVDLTDVVVDLARFALIATVTVTAGCG